MADWFRYTLNDYLLFSPEVYWRLLQTYTSSFGWLATVFELLAILVFVYVYRIKKYALVSVFIALLLCMLGVGFFMQQYATINPFAPYLAYACFAQSAMLILYPFVTNKKSGNDLVSGSAPKHHQVLALACLSIIITAPFLALFLSFGWQAGVVGILPVPTLLIAAMSSLLHSHYWRLFLLPIPVLLLVIELLTLMMILGA